MPCHQTTLALAAACMLGLAPAGVRAEQLSPIPAHRAAAIALLEQASHRSRPQGNICPASCTQVAAGSGTCTGPKISVTARGINPALPLRLASF